MWHTVTKKCWMWHTVTKKCWMWHTVIKRVGLRFFKIEQGKAEDFCLIRSSHLIYSFDVALF